MLLKKMLRDIGLHKTQFLSIFVMAFLGVFIYTGIAGEWMGLRKGVDDYYGRTNFASAFLYGADFGAADEAAVKNVPGVTGAQRSLVLDAVGKLPNSPKLTLHFLDANDISRPYLVRGSKFSPDGDGIWIDDRFAKAHSLSPGDKMTVSVSGVSLEETIRGTVYSPEYVYLVGTNGMTPDFSAVSYAYLPARAFPVPEAAVSNRMELTVSGDAIKVEDAVKNALGSKISVYLSRENNPSDAMIEQEIAQHRSMGSIFPVAFLLIALLTILTTMTRIVTNQRTQIGTLKAVGFQNRRITLHYVGYGFTVSLAGAVLGAAIGPLSLPKLFYPSLSGFYTLPRWQPVLHLSFWGMAALTVALCTLVTYLACRSVLRDVPAGMLRPKAPKTARHGVLEKTPLWKRLGFNLQWNIRDLFRNKIRSLMAMVGVLGCTALLVCALGINDDMSDMKAWQFSDLNHFATKLTVSDTATSAQIDEAVQKTGGGSVMEASVEIETVPGPKSGSEPKAVKKSGALTVDDSAGLVRKTDENRRHMTLPDDGLAISYKMAGQLGVGVGDSIRFHIYGDDKWIESRVAAVYRDPSAQGITLSKAQFEKFGFTYRATSIVTPGAVYEKAPGISTVQQNADMQKDWDSMTEALMVMIGILIAAASLLAVVVLYNLGILSYTEMERELATLKVLGFSSNKVRRLLLSQNLILSAAGFVLGIPLGKWLLVTMTSTMGDSFDMITVIHAGNVLLSLLIVFALSCLVNLLFRRRIKTLDMVGSLKGVE